MPLKSSYPKIGRKLCLIKTDVYTVNRLQVKNVYVYCQVVKDDLEKHQASLNDSASLAEDLLSASDDPVAAAELQSRLSRAELELKQLAQKIDERKDKLEAALSQSGQFETDFDDFLRWLTKTERTVAKLRPISADPATVQEQKDSYQVRVDVCVSQDYLLSVCLSVCVLTVGLSVCLFVRFVCSNGSSTLVVFLVVCKQRFSVLYC